MSFGSFLSARSGRAIDGGDSSVLADDHQNEVKPAMASAGEERLVSLSIEESATTISTSSSSSPKPLKSKKSVGFVPTGKVRWFNKRDTTFDDEEFQIDFSEEQRKVQRKNLVDSERLPFSMSLLGNDAFAANESSSKHQVVMAKPIRIHTATPKKKIQVVLLHSQQYTKILYQAMKHIHQDRDLLLDSLLKWCGFFRGAQTIDDNGAVKRGASLSAFLTILPPKVGTRRLLELFHVGSYLDLLEYKEGSSGMKSEVANRDDDQHASFHTFDDDLAPFSLGNEREEEEEERDISFSSDETELQTQSESKALLRKLLSEYGLEDDCPLPTDDNSRALLWKYCLSVSGASWHAACLLAEPDNEYYADVVVNWGGGRHHAHSSKAGGFCYVNDIVLAIKRLLQSDSVDDFGIPTPSRVLYIDIDIHHCDGVQQAFYSTDRVMTSSFHRNSPGFFPTTSGFVREKGEVDTVGFGYNLNVPLPSGIDDITFLMMYRKMLFGLVKSFDPDFIVLCVGADGLEGDALLNGQIYNSDHSSTGEGWSLSPEGLAECVRLTSSLCAGLKEETICARPAKEEQHDEDTRGRGAETEIMNNARESLELGKRRKLLVLGGGGYSPAQTARANLLCTAAACEGARSGLLWSELPKDIPTHDYFPRYGPLFELVSEEKKQQIWDSYDVDCGAIGVTKDSSSPFFGRHALQQGIHAIELACLFIDRQRKKAANFNSLFESEPNDRDDDIWVEDIRRKKKTSQGGRRKKKKV